MCIVVDTCTLSAVFNPKNDEHKDYKIVVDWVMNKNNPYGKFVFGGSKYLEELGKTGFLSLMLEYKKIGKAISLPNNTVDSVEKNIISKTTSKKFNDQHLVAIIIVSGCKLLCSSDKKAFPYLKDPKYYPKTKRPKIYTKSSKGSPAQANLFCDKNIAKICKPCK